MNESNQANESTSAFERASVSLKLNGNDSYISPTSISIIEFDSIYQFYPKVKLSVSDSCGFMNEYLAFVDGTQIEILLGENDDSAKKCKFVVYKNSVPQQKTSTEGTGGDFEIELIHDYYNNQFKKSKGYQSNISDIIESLVYDYDFNSVDIETTINTGLWYQPNITDADFIVNYLSPFAYSSSSSDTPFFTFIDSNNNFNFKSFNSMFATNPVQELNYGTNDVFVTVSKDVLSSISFLQLDYNKIRPMLNVKYHNYDDSGNIVFNSDKLIDYLNTQGKYPVVKGKSEGTTNIVGLYDYDVDADDTENNNDGYKINLHKESILPDKIIINTILNKNLVCGKTVQVNLPMTDSNQTTNNSLRNTGKYLIESSYHIWDKISSRTMLVCSKQNIKITDDYRNKELLLS